MPDLPRSVVLSKQAVAGRANEPAYSTSTDFLSHFLQESLYKNHFVSSFRISLYNKTSNFVDWLWLGHNSNVPKAMTSALLR